jgi:hypothetical protein
MTTIIGSFLILFFALIFLIKITLSKIDDLEQKVKLLEQKIDLTYSILEKKNV